MKPIIQNHSGSVLAAALILLAILTIMGITGISTSSTEIRIAANDMRHRQVFYQADGGTQVAVELIEQAFGCANHLPFPQSLTIGSARIDILNPHFTQPDADTGTKDIQITSEHGLFITEIRITGTFSGAGNIMAAPPSGQEYILYEIVSQARDHGNNALARIRVCYRHVLGVDMACPYDENSVAHGIPGALASGILSWEVVE